MPKWVPCPPWPPSCPRGPNSKKKRRLKLKIYGGFCPPFFHLPRWRTAQGYQSTRRLRQVPKLKVRLCLARGFCPPFWGGTTHSPSKVRFCLTMFYRGLLPPNFGGSKFAPPFFEFWARWNCPRADPGPPLTTSLNRIDLNKSNSILRTFIFVSILCSADNLLTIRVTTRFIGSNLLH